MVYNLFFMLISVLIASSFVMAGVLACLDGYMNIALEQTEEYVNGQLKNKYGDAFIRGNNGMFSLILHVKPHYFVSMKLNKVLPESHGPHGGAGLHFLALGQTLEYTARNVDMGLAHHVVCVFTPKLMLERTAPTRGGMARLS